MEIIPNLAINTLTNDPIIIKYLQQQGFFSVADITLLSKNRFLQRHAAHLDGQAEIIYHKALSINQQKYVADLAVATNPAHSPIQFSPSAQDFNYQTLFQEDWSSCCHPDSLFSQDSPVAYLVFLYRFAKQLDADKKKDSLALDERRPDLKSLMINPSNFQQENSTLNQVNAILKETIQAHLGKKSLNRELATTRYPFNFPYDHSMEQIKLGLQESGVELNELREQLQVGYPYYYLQEEKNDYVTARPLQLAYNNWCPEQYRILLEPQLFQEKVSGLLSQQDCDYFLKNYGQKFASGIGHNSVFDRFNSLNKFSQITGLQPQDIYYLMPTQVFIQHGVSKNCPHAQLQHNKIEFTYSRYISRKGQDLAWPSYVVANSTEITSLNYLMLERCERLIRLQQWTGLSYPELNELFIALELSNSKAINQNQSFLRLLGMFRRLKKQFPSLVLDQFIALVWVISPYTNVDRPQSFYDQLFNSSTQTPLILDNSEFDPEKTNEVSVKQTVDSLCAGLGISTAEFSYLCKWLYGSSTKPKRSCECIANLYHCVQLPRLLGWEFKEGLFLFDLFPQVKKLLRFHRQLKIIYPDLAKQHKEADVLDLMQQLIWLTSWLKRIACQPSEITDILVTPNISVVGKPNISIVSSPNISLNSLSNYSKFDARDFDSLLKLNETIVQALNKQSPDLYTKASELSEQDKTTVLSIMAEYFEVDSGVLMEAILKWVGVTKEYFYNSILSLTSNTNSSLCQLKQKIVRYVKAVKRFKLSVTVINWLCKYPEQWYPSAKKFPLTCQRIYLITRFKDFVAQSKHTEAVCIDYFKTANSEKVDPIVCQQKLAQLMCWDSEEIARAQTNGKPARTVKEIDYLLRLQHWSQTTGLSVSALQKAARLQPENIDKAYLNVVEDYEMLASEVISTVQRRQKNAAAINDN